MHGSAAGTATPKQPKNSGIQRFNKDSLRFLFVQFHKVAVIQKHVCCPLHAKPNKQSGIPCTGLGVPPVQVKVWAVGDRWADLKLSSTLSL